MWALVASGPFWFGVVIGYITYRTLKHTKHAGVADIAAVVAAVGGGVVINLFPVTGGRFDDYAIGLAVGFFIYLALSLAISLWKGAKDADEILGGTMPGE
jgi:hypothetical protein